MRYILPVMFALLLAGCGAQEDRLHAPATTENAANAAYIAARILPGKPVLPTYAIGMSYGDLTPINAQLILVSDWEHTALGQVVVYNDAGPVMHQIVGGSKASGWIVKGMANIHADDVTVTESNYVATYYGYVLHQ